jgi:hypothetical protein
MQEPTLNSIIEKYIDAWITHDNEIIREIFDTSASYNIEGKQPLKGIEAICDYWERNKRRQHNLRILPPLKLTSDPNTEAFIFCASFADSEERENQTVYGHIQLRLQEGKVVSLMESYVLERNPLDPQSTGIGQQIVDLLRRARWHAKNISKLVFEYLLTRGATLLVTSMTIVLGFSALNIRELPDWLLRSWAFSFDFASLTTETRNDLITKAYHHISTLVTIFVFLVPFMGWLRYQIRLPITIKNLQGPDHDLSVMKRRFKGARHLIVFAGDFDFVGRDQELLSIFWKLHAQNGLILISDKSEDEVRRGFGTHVDAALLLRGLRERGKIFFSHTESIRCSIVRGWLGSEIIYRYEGGNADSLSNQHLCIMKGRREAKPLMELVEKLLKPALAPQI